MCNKKILLIIAGLLGLICVLLSFSACDLIYLSCEHRVKFVSKVIKEETCLEDGEKIYKCEYCGHEETVIVPADPNKHKWDDGTVLTQPTCTEEGSRKSTCTICGKERTVTLQPTGHTLVAIGEAHDPTCQSTGITAGAKCSKCGTVTEAQQVIEKLDHDYENDVCKYCNKQKEYNFIFVAFGQTLKTVTTTANNVSNVAPVAPQVTGYDYFGDWELTNVNGDDVTYTAKYTPINYRISYKNVEGWYNSNPESYTIEDRVVLSPAKKTGYTFKGWLYNGEKINGINVGSYGNMELTAQWEITTYTIKYENYKNNDISSYPTSYTIESETIPLGEISAVGYTFAGWQISGKTVDKIAKGTYGNLVVRANFIPYKYKVNLDSNGGKASSTVVTVDYGSNYVLPVPQREGYSFVGWFDAKDSDATDYAGANGASVNAYQLLNDITLYAHWKDLSYTVKFDSGGGSAVASQEYVYNHAFILPPSPTKQGSTFDGWYSEDGSEYTETTVVSQDVTLYAKWIESVAISDAEGLIAVASAPEQNYYLTCDIDLRGNIWTPIATFSGILDGKGFTIKNFSISSTSPSANYGFICVNNGTVKNLNFTDFTFNVSSTDKDSLNIAVVVAKNNGNVSNCKLLSGVIKIKCTDNKVTEGFTDSKQTVVGGIVGFNGKEGVVAQCSSAIDIVYQCTNTTTSTRIADTNKILYSYVGGIVGSNVGSVQHCAYLAAVQTTDYTQGNSYWGSHNADNYLYIGGLIGHNYNNGACTNCYTVVDLKTISSRGDYGRSYSRIGGLVGLNNENAAITGCYSNGTLAGGSDNGNNMGGLVGLNTDGAAVESCYSTATIDTNKAGNLGGLCGQNESVIQNSFATGNVTSTANANVGGLCGNNTSNGTLTKCFSTGDAATAGGGKAGHSIGQNSGVVFKLYHMQGTIVLKGGTYLDVCSDDGLVTPIHFTQLWNEDFLVDILYWDSEGWVIVTDESPLLEWETAVSHNFTKTVFEPDCERGGFTLYSCLDCDRLYIKDFVAALGHDYVEMQIVNPTCSTDGYTVKKCSVCGDQIEKDRVAATGHPQEQTTLKSDNGATCVSDGYYVYHCNACNNDFVVNEAAKGHSGTKVRSNVEPTCTVEGEDVYFCAVCNQEYTVKVPCAVHTWTDVAYKVPTCGIVMDDSGNITDRNPVAGNTAGVKCSVCGFVDYGCETLEPHAFELVSTLSEPSCSGAGSGIFKCTLCEYEEEQTIEQLKHSDENNDYICDVCNSLLFTDSVLSSFTHISDIDGLRAIANNLSNNYWLDADIDLSETEWVPIGTAERPFKGIFYGNNHAIKGLSLSAQDSSQSLVGGVFGYNSGWIYCITVTNFSVEVKNTDVVFGGLVAHNSGRVVNCKVTNLNTVTVEVELIVNDYNTHVTNLDGSVIGGLIGINHPTGIVENNSVTGEIAAIFINKSLVRSAKVNQFIKSLIYSTSAKTVQTVTFGGIVGVNEGDMSKCSVTSNISSVTRVIAELTWMKGKAFAYTHLYAGALVGYNSGSICECEVVAMTYNIPDSDLQENVQSIWNGSLFQIEFALYNYSKTQGIDGIVGASDKNAILTDLTIN